jgi:preprotein translocase SecE subunit
MATVTKNNENPMADKASDDDANLPVKGSKGESGGEPQPLEYAQKRTKQASSHEGFFTIYKSGQGYWTRMGTVAGGVLIIGSTASFLYTNMPAWGVGTQARLISIGVGILAMALGAFALMNRPKVTDFLIATDSEMKKVNWTSRRELIGSTRVVIFAVVLIGLVLFYFDLIFSKFFNLLGVLKTDPIEFGNSLQGHIWRIVIWAPVAATVVMVGWIYLRKEQDSWRR